MHDPLSAECAHISVDPAFCLAYKKELSPPVDQFSISPGVHDPAKFEACQIATSAAILDDQQCEQPF
jgi:hypothetical protein